MRNEYFSRAPRYICGNKKRYLVEAKILKEGDVARRNKGFNFFIREIERGADIEKAKKRAWNRYQVKVTYEFEKRMVTDRGRKKLKVVVE